MKEQYIRQVKKDLHASRKRKNEVARDLNEIFASAAEHFDGGEDPGGTRTDD